MKKNLLLLTLLFWALCAKAQIPPGYYNAAAGLTGPALKIALHNIIKNHTVVSYASLWTHFQTTDKKPSGKVWDIYSDVPGGTPPYEFTYTSDQCGSYAAEGDCYNREHSWPQSWFSSATVPSSDLFHIYPTDGYVNNKRSNYPYGDSDGAGWISQNGGSLGFCTDPGYTGAVFEPIDEYKGDVARSYFYMSTRYMTEDASWSTSPATNLSTILPWQASVLLQWSHLDTVSAKEIARNNAIYGIQNNRNPYIDHPQWADSIWAILATGIAPAADENVSLVVYPNPVNNALHISNQGKEVRAMKLEVMNALGELMVPAEQISLNALDGDYQINCEGWSSGIYYISLSDSRSKKVMRFVKM